MGGKDFEVEGVSEMNILELACVAGNLKLVQYLIDDCSLRSAKDFQMANKNGLVDAMHFISVPIL